MKLFDKVSTDTAPMLMFITAINRISFSTNVLLALWYDVDIADSRMSAGYKQASDDDE